MSSTLQKFLEPLFERMPQLLLHDITDIQADEPTQARIDELADKCSDGMRTAAERTEYENYVGAIFFVSILQRMALRVLPTAGATDGTRLVAFPPGPLPKTTLKYVPLQDDQATFLELVRDLKPAQIVILTDEDESVGYLTLTRPVVLAPLPSLPPLIRPSAIPDQPSATDPTPKQARKLGTLRRTEYSIEGWDGPIFPPDTTSEATAVTSEQAKLEQEHQEQKDLAEVVYQVPVGAAIRVTEGDRTVARLQIMFLTDPPSTEHNP
jgi:hypothetical protein